MSLYSWNVIATVAEHHSISQAANILNLTPSAVSHMVKKVEDGVGYALFIRERNHFELTSSGKALLPYIQNYLKSGNALVEEALRLKNSVTGSVHIAAYNNVIRDWLPSILQQFHQSIPTSKFPSARPMTCRSNIGWRVERSIWPLCSTPTTTQHLLFPFTGLLWSALLPRTMPLGTALV